MENSKFFGKFEILWCDNTWYPRSGESLIKNFDVFHFQKIELMGTAKRVDTFLLLLLLLSIFVNFITKKACYTWQDGISITFHRCDLYDVLDSFALSTFHRIKLKYVTTTKKSVCLLLLLLCGDIESQPGPTNNSEFKTLISKKGINFCH